MNIRRRNNLPIAGILLIIAGCADQSRLRESTSAGSSAPQIKMDASSSPSQDFSEVAMGGKQESSQKNKNVTPSKAAPDGKPAVETNGFELVKDSRADRMLIRNAKITIETENPKQVGEKLIAAVIAAKGYVSNRNETTDSLGGQSVSMQLRIPAIDFDRTITSFDKYGRMVENHMTSEDVTEDFVGTQSTLRNAKRTEARLLEHLSRTGKLSDTLLIEKQLSRVRGEVEQLEGHVRFVSHRVDFSTIDLTLQEKAKPQATVPPESYSSGKEYSEASRSLIGFMREMWTKVIWLGVWAIVWVPIAFVIIVIGRNIIKKKRSHPAVLAQFEVSRP